MGGIKVLIGSRYLPDISFRHDALPSSSSSHDNGATSPYERLRSPLVRDARKGGGGEFPATFADGKRKSSRGELYVRESEEEKWRIGLHENTGALRTNGVSNPPG